LQDLASLALNAMASESDLLKKIECGFGADNELNFGYNPRYADCLTFYVKGNYLYIGLISEYYEALSAEDPNGQNPYAYAKMKVTVETVYPNIKYKN